MTPIGARTPRRFTLMAEGRQGSGLYPHGRWRTRGPLSAHRAATTLPCLACSAGRIDGECFPAYVEQILLPSLEPGDIVVMDMCRRPRWCKIFRKARVLACVRPFAAVVHAGGPYGSSRSGSNSILRARSAYHDRVFRPVSLTVATILSD
jgi:hypothetical protein